MRAVTTATLLLMLTVLAACEAGSSEVPAANAEGTSTPRALPESSPVTQASAEAGAGPATQVPPDAALDIGGVGAVGGVAPRAR